MAEQAQPLPQLFGIIPTGLPPITTPTACPTPTSLVYTLPTTRDSTHLVVFLLPGVTLPPNTAAAIYLQVPSPSATSPAFNFLGAIGPGKESAIFKISGLLNSNNPSSSTTATSSSSEPPTTLTLGISIEDAAAVAAQMAAQQQPEQNNALVKANRATPATADPTLLAQRIIKNAFNFLASFSGNTAGGVEVVPLKAFEEWWKKFEAKVRTDPSFLQRDAD